jgi:putative endonuclease
MDAKDLGRTGEEIAADYLTGLGWEVVERNWRFSGGGLRGELDVIARQPDHTLVIVEVKTRSGTGYGTGFEAITPQKSAQLRALTGRWLAEHRDGFERVRIDAVAILAPPGGPVTLEHRRGVI